MSLKKMNVEREAEFGVEKYAWFEPAVLAHSLVFGHSLAAL